MRRSIKLASAGLLVVGTLALSAVGADARGGGGCGPCYFVGITPAPGGSPEGGGFQANSDHEFGHSYRNRDRGHGPYNGGYYRGY